jgi:hypothetical protein
MVIIFFHEYISWCVETKNTIKKEKNQSHEFTRKITTHMKDLMT